MGAVRYLTLRAERFLRQTKFEDVLGLAGWALLVLLAIGELR